MMKRILTLVILFLSVISSLTAASFSVDVPRNVYEHDKFSVTYKLKNAEGTNAQFPPISGCDLIYGPSTSTSHSYQIINGRQSSSSSVDYVFYYRAGKAGTYTIPAASIIVNGKRMNSNAVTMTVLPSTDRDKPASQRPVQYDEPETQTSERAVGKNDVFVRINFSQNSAYEQEAIGCTIKLYTKYQISSFMVTRQPAFDGFLIQEENIEPDLNRIEVVNGQQYMTATLKRCIIFPQKSGHLTINSGNYDLSVIQYDQTNMGGFSVGVPREKKIKVTSNTGSIDIKPLPAGAPDGFNGAVGKFTAEKHLVGNSFRTGDAATLIYTISGTGNIKYLKEPVIDFPDEFELYTPKSDIQADISGNNVTGSMKMEYTFVPQSVGNFSFTVPDFVYFDPTEKQYKTISGEKFDIKVAQGVGNSASGDRKDIELKNQDIRHIYLGDKTPVKEHKMVVTELWYWMLYLGLIVALIGAVIATGAARKRHADVNRMRQSRAGRTAKSRLKAAEKALKAHNNELFFEEILKAIWGYLSDKLAMPASQLTRQNVVEALTQKGYNEELIQQFIQVLDDSEMARYTSQGIDPEQVYRQASAAINGMEDFKLPKAK